MYGFLGRNGAGKTTTIRLLLGLIHATRGCAMLYGQDVSVNPKVLSRVSALVEDPGFYHFMSGRDNLRTLVRTAGEKTTDRVGRLLDQVGLEERADQRVAGYSKGMRQRLGIAAALLGDPELIILDEPTNGLDPKGIQEIRGFIRDLVDVHGKTVFLSSHLLSEVEQVCDRVAILHHGRVLPLAFFAVVFAGEYQWGTWKNLVPRTRLLTLLLSKGTVAVLIVAFTILLMVPLSSGGQALFCKVGEVSYGPALSADVLRSFVKDFSSSSLIGLLALLMTLGFAALASVLSRSILGGFLGGFGFSMVETMVLGLLVFIRNLFDSPEIINLYRFAPVFNLDNLRMWFFQGQA